jgi:hypothetical protein
MVRAALACLLAVVTWCTNYSKAVLAKLKVGGAHTAHNVLRGGRRGMTGDFFDCVTKLPHIDSGFRAGVFVPFKTAS